MANKRKRRRGPKQKSRFSTTAILIVAGAAVLAVGLLIVLNRGQAQTAAVVPEVTYETGVTPEGEPYKGSPDAPLQLVEYSDFLCPHCGTFAATIDSLSPDYIETGELQVVYRNYAFLATESVQAAQAAECALDQGADEFWQYHDLLFANQGTGRSAFSRSRLMKYAEQIGLDTASFRTCLNSNAKAAEVQSDLAEGNSLGVTSTPTWVLNGQIVRGSLSESDLRQLFEGILSAGS
jgi:protein-disulfide isomerase